MSRDSATESGLASETDLGRTLLYLSPPLLVGSFLLLTSFFDLTPKLGVYNGKRLLQLFTMLLFFLATLLVPEIRNRSAQYFGRIPKPVAGLLCVGFSLGILSALRFDDVYPIADVAMFGLLILMIPVVAACRSLTTDRFDKLFLLLFVVLGAGVFLQEMIGLLAAWLNGLEFSYSSSMIRFAHPRLYNHFQTWTVPLIAALPVLFSRHRSILLLSVFLLGIQWYLVLMTGARGTAVSILTAFIFMTLLAPRLFHRWARAHGFGFVIGLLIYALILQTNSSFAPEQNSYFDQSLGRALLHTTGRNAFWQHAASQIHHQPLLGVGPARFSCDAPASFAASPHNLPIQVFAEWGIPAGVVLVWAGAILALTFLKHLKSSIAKVDEQSLFNLLLGASLVAAATHSNVSGLLIPPSSQMTAIFIGGWAFSAMAPTLATLQKTNSKSTPGIYVLLIVALCSLTFLLILARSELTVMQFRTAYVSEINNSSPHFWQNGHICLYRYESP